MAGFSQAALVGTRHAVHDPEGNRLTLVTPWEAAGSPAMPAPIPTIDEAQGGDPREGLWREVAAAGALGFDVVLAEDPCVRDLAPGLVALAVETATEGVVEAVRHAPPGPVRVSLTLDRESGVLDVVVRSSRDRADPRLRREALALRSLHERIAAVGGTLATLADDCCLLLFANIPLGAR